MEERYVCVEARVHETMCLREDVVVPLPLSNLEAGPYCHASSDTLVL